VGALVRLGAVNVTICSARLDRRKVTWRASRRCPRAPGASSLHQGGKAPLRRVIAIDDLVSEPLTVTGLAE